MKLNDFIVQIEEMLAHIEPTKMSFVDKQALALYIAAYYCDEDWDKTLTTYDVAEVLLTLVLAGSTLAEQALKSHYLYNCEFTIERRIYVYRVEFLNNVYYIQL